MVSIRLQVNGKMNDPFYRIVVIDSHKKNSGYAHEILGYWGPSKNYIKIDKKKVSDWEKRGAKVSSAVKKLIS